MRFSIRRRAKPFDPNWVVHPGTTIEDGIEELGISPAELALRMGITYQHMAGLLAGYEPLTAADAEALSLHLGGTPRFWTNHERIFRDGLAAGKEWNNTNDTKEQP